MKKLVLLAVGAILLLGVVAVVAVRIASRDPDGAPGSGAPAGRVKAVLTLELEAQSCGGFAVLGSSVKS